MRFRTALTYFSLLPLSACTRSCNEYDNNEEFAKAKLPAYTETGANTLGCVLGPQTWTVLGKHERSGIGGFYWEPNELQVNGGYSVSPLLYVRGELTGVRNSKTFYDTDITLMFRPSDTLGGLRLLGADTSRGAPYRGENMVVTNLMRNDTYKSSSRHPIRLLVRKLNRQQHIVSGTFSGMLYQYHGSDSLAVADGRFDLRY